MVNNMIGIDPDFGKQTDPKEEVRLENRDIL